MYRMPCIVKTAVAMLIVANEALQERTSSQPLLVAMESVRAPENDLELQGCTGIKSDSIWVA